MAKNGDMLREERVTKEIRKLNRLAKTLTPTKQKAAEGMVRRIAFMQVTLEDLEDDINWHGTVEPFSQGDAEPYDRERPAVRIYNSMIRNYATVCKQFIDLLPAEITKAATDELMAFVKRPARK